MKNKIIQKERALQMHKNRLGREVIEARDIAIIRGATLRTAYRHISKVKENLNKTKDQVVTIKEFCFFYGYDYRDIYAKINGFIPFEVDPRMTG